MGRVTPRRSERIERAEPAAAEVETFERPDEQPDERPGADGVESDMAGLEVLARPVPRTSERVAARFGLLPEAPVVITEGAQLPQAGLLLALPALEATGLLAVAEQT